MIKIPFKLQKRFFIFILILCFIFLGQVSLALSKEAKNGESHRILSSQNGPFPQYRILRVEHEGIPHKNLGLEEGKIPGICPQERNTPQAPEPVYRMTNPLDPTPENLRAGETLFKIDARPTACKVCHGFGGDGLGVIFEQLTPKPRNFTCYYTMDDIPDGQIYWIIKNGSAGTRMPSFGALSDKQVWQLVLYIRQFSQKTK